MVDNLAAQDDIRMPAVAGVFYPSDAAELTQTVTGLLAATGPLEALPRRLSAIVVPHAGYVYSGPVAASAYAYLRQRHAQSPVRRIVLLGPAHRVGFVGMALAGCAAFQTPLGNVSVDADLVKIITALPAASTLPVAHAQEHSLEVQLPFLQICCPNTPVVPLLVGDVDADAVAGVLNALGEDDDTFIVISSDLSHFLSYADAQQKDLATSALIEARSPVLEGEQACGCRPLNGLLQYCEARDWHVKALDVRNSGDTAGDKSRVVGYGAYVVY